MGSDIEGFKQFVRYKPISIHAPRVGSDDVVSFQIDWSVEFQSTLPVWGATLNHFVRAGLKQRFQSTLPVWGATIFDDGFTMEFEFQSTLPVWGATFLFLLLYMA